MNYFLWNKASDYQQGYLENLRTDGNELVLSDYRNKQAGYFISRTVKTGETGVRWHRLKTDIKTGDNMTVIITVYATDSLQRVREVEALLQNDDIPGMKEKRKQLDCIKQLELTNPADVLLDTVKGAYLWIGVVLWGHETDGPSVRMLQLYYPRETWSSYLPGIYRGQDQAFLHSYLAIFQTLYQEMEKNIRTDTGFLDVQTAKYECLLWLAQWLQEENGCLWQTERLRHYLQEAPQLYRTRGTARGLIRMVELFTGEAPYLSETETDEDTVTLYLRAEIIADPGSYEALQRLIREGKPADTEVRLIALRPYVFLDQHVYLGINSRLNEYRAAVLGTGAALDVVVLGGMNDEESALPAV